MQDLLRKRGPFRHPNLRRFVWFKMLYGARAYYPILAIFFVDLGLTLDQFVILNVAWAISIVMLEVPSGALADVMGRRRLLITASLLMATEMAILVFAPANGGGWLFALCLFNRVLSGASEAAASGADQALAYDTLDAAGEAHLWDDTLSTAMSWRSAAFMVAMGLGGMLYSPELVNRAFDYCGISLRLQPETALRLPVMLVFLQALGCLWVTFRMREVGDAPHAASRLRERAIATWRTTTRAAAWVYQTPLALTLVTGGFLIDAVLRNFATINSQYYRLVEIPEWTYGFIAAGGSALGIFVPQVARRIGKHLPPVKHLVLVFIAAIAGVSMLAPAWPFWSVLPAILCLTLLGWNSFVMDRHLNELTPSHQRATVLSVKGLASNLAYGTYSLAFAGLLAVLRPDLADSDAAANEALSGALTWQPWYFALTLVAFLFFATRGKQSLEESI